MNQERLSLSQLVQGNPYPGRGIFVGMSPEGEKAMVAYFIMGRSANSRNRVFVLKDKDLFTQPFDLSLVEDPRLIIYRAMTANEERLIVTNGDQTDTLVQGEKQALSFDQALMTRRFEPDGPNWTPRISAILRFEEGSFTYEMSILKAGDPEGKTCQRAFFHYEPQPGKGHFLSTYCTDGSPLPSFMGEPKEVAIEPPLSHFCDQLWQALDPENKVSLYVRYIELKTGHFEERIFNARNE